jgi:hypothetical protein
MSEFKQNIDDMILTFDHLGRLIVNQYFDKVDSSFYMRTIYLSYLQRVLEFQSSQPFNQSVIDLS